MRIRFDHTLFIWMAWILMLLDVFTPLDINGWLILGVAMAPILLVIASVLWMSLVETRTHESQNIQDN